MSYEYAPDTTYVIIDTNFFLAPGQFGVDIFEGIAQLPLGKHTLCVVEKTLDELEKLSQGGDGVSGKDASAARLGRQMLDKMVSEGDLTVLAALKTEKHLNADKMILNRVKVPNGPRFVVATQDKALKDELREKGVSLVVLRQKKRIELIGGH